MDYMRGDPTLRPQFAAVDQLCVPLVVLGELYYGAQRAQRREDAFGRVREFLKIATLLPADENTAERCAEIKAELARIGRLIPENDLWIAAAAKQHEIAVATRDAHFSLVPGLKTLPW